MGRIFLIDLEGQIFRCRTCDAHLGKADELIDEDSRSLHLNNYLMSNVVNVFFEDKSETTIMGTKVYMYCVRCSSRVGWRVEDLENCLFYWGYQNGKYLLARYSVNPPAGYERFWF